MASVLLLVFCIIATCTSVYGHMAGVEREPKCSPFDYDKKTLENMVRMEHAMELMNAKVDNSLKALREELEEFDSMKLRLNEQLENNQKSFRKEFDSVKLQLNEQLENNQKTVELLKEDQEKYKQTLLDELENRPSIAFSALWIVNTNPSVNDVLRFTRILLNDNDVYDANTGEFKALVNGTYTFTSSVCVNNDKYMYLQYLADDVVIGSFITGDKDWSSCTSSTVMNQLLKGQIVKLYVAYKHGSGTIVRNDEKGYLSSFSGMLIK